MTIKEKIINHYPLQERVSCALECYQLANKRYLVFVDALIDQKNIMQVLQLLENETNCGTFSEWKTLIVVGETQEPFKKGDLFYFNGVNTFVVFYLIDNLNQEIYMNDSWIFTVGLNYRKYVRKIDKIVRE